MKTQVKRHFDHIAKLYDKFKEKNRYYYDHIKRFLTENVPVGARVLEVGCGTGELLNHAKPAYGYGIDLSEGMIEIARAKFPHLTFGVGEAENCSVPEWFEYVLMIDLLDHVHDVWDVLRGIECAVRENTILCIATINPLWQPIFNVAEWLKLKMPEGPHNFIPIDDIVNLLEILDYRILRKEMRFLVPKRIPFISEFINKHISKIPILRNLCAVQAIVAQKLAPSQEKAYSCTVVVPCHNEVGNVEECVRTVPQMGRGTQLMFVNDGSTDGTLEKLEQLKTQYPHIGVISYPDNRGKGYAVREAFQAASGDILMILDADLTVPAEDLREFYYVLAHGKARFVNGSRLVYPLENQSMRTVNLWGNQFFGMIMSWLVGQHISDTLCGSKALFRADYMKMKMGTDKWGDYDLLFGASRLNLKIAEVPIHYLQRRHGASKMRTFHHGLLLARMCLWGFFHIKLKRMFSRKNPVTETS